MEDGLGAWFNENKTEKQLLSFGFRTAGGGAQSMNLRGLQFVCLLSIGSLFALIGLRQFFVEPLEDKVVNASVFLVQVLPLLLVLPGILRLKPRSYLLAVLAAMLYFCHGVWLAVAPEQRVLGLGGVGLAMVGVLAGAYALRHLKLAGALQTDDAPADGQ